VNSAFYMNRALRLFEKQGFDVIPYKVAGNSKLTILDFLPSAGNLVLFETRVRELLGRIFYLFKN
jgi:uncharacterized SAM-binding protein YcdF (DUF218 family)